MAQNTKKSPAAVILLAWLLVGVPLGWGVYNTLLSSMKLFQAAPVQTMAPAPYSLRFGRRFSREIVYCVHEFIAVAVELIP